MQLIPAFVGVPETNRVYNLDLFALCAAMPAGSVDMILCDLPYGTTACAWDSIIPFTPMWGAFKRVIKPRGAIVLTAAQPFTSALVMSNPKMFKYDWVWEKDRISGFLDAAIKPLKAHESILVFCSSSPVYYPQKTTGHQLSNKHGERLKPVLVYREGVASISEQTTDRFPRSVQKFNTVNSAHGILHPTQKPVDLFRYLIRTYTQPNELVFDPCVGSGTTAIAAREEGRRFVVGDSSPEYVQVARNRLALPYTPSFMPMLETA